MLVQLINITIVFQEIQQKNQQSVTKLMLFQ